MYSHVKDKLIKGRFGALHAFGIILISAFLIALIKHNRPGHLTGLTLEEAGFRSSTRSTTWRVVEDYQIG